VGVSRDVVETSPSVRGGAARRALDVVAAGVLLVAVSPLLLLGMATVAAAGGRPVFFGHRRLGLGGRPFRCWKLRTMTVDAERQLDLDPDLRNRHEANGYKLPNGSDPRVTRWGRWLRRTYLDEIPQLLNVLVGDMSMVGPRPIVPAELELFGAEGGGLLQVKPGIFGGPASSRRRRRAGVRPEPDGGLGPGHPGPLRGGGAPGAGRRVKVHPRPEPVSGAQQVAANGLALLLAYVLPRLFTVVAIVVAARVLGTGDFGVYGAAAALAVMLAVMVSLGMHPLLVREIARHPRRAGTLIGAAHRVKTVAALAMLGAAVVLGRVLFPDQGEAQAATLVLCVGWVLQAYAENLSAYFQAVERMGRWTQASALFGLISSAAGVALLLATGSLVAFSCGFTLGWGAALAWLHHRLPSEAVGTEAPALATVMELARGTAPFAAAFIALTLYCKVDVLLLRHWGGDEQVGLYAAAYKFVDVFQALVIVAAGAVYPRLSRSAVTRGPGPWAGTRSTELLLLVAAPAGLTLHLVAYPLVALLYGPGYAASGPVLSWIGLLLPLLALSLHSGYVLAAAGRILPMAVLYSAGVLLNVALNAWLIPLRGAEGAALARLGSEAVVASAFLATVGALARAAPRVRTALLALGLAVVAAALSAMPDPTGGWLRASAFVALTLVTYLLLGAAQPGEARAFLAALRRGARPGDAGTAG